MKDGKIQLKDLLFKSGKKGLEERKETNEKLYTSLMHKVEELMKKIEEQQEEDRMYFATLHRHLKIEFNAIPNGYAQNLDREPGINRGFIDGVFTKIQAYENQLNGILDRVREDKKAEIEYEKKERETKYSFKVLDVQGNAARDIVFFYSALAQLNENYWPVISKLGLQRGYDSASAYASTKLHEYWLPKPGKFKDTKPKDIEEYEFILQTDLSDEKNKEHKKNFEMRYIRTAIQLLVKIQNFINDLSEKIKSPDQSILPHPDDKVDLKIIEHEDVDQYVSFIENFKNKSKREAIKAVTDFVNNIITELRISDIVETSK